MSYKTEAYQLAAVLFALLVGLMVNLVEWPAEGIYLFALFSYSYSSDYDLLGVFMPFLHSLLHTYAFILLTVIAVRNHPQMLFIILLSWAGIGWLFELGQHSAVYEILLEHIPEWFSASPVLENSANYFQYGTFEPLDLLATLACALGYGQHIK